MTGVFTDRPLFAQAGQIMRDEVDEFDKARHAKSTHMTLVHFTMRPANIVILSNAKNLSERPFAECSLSDKERCFVSLSMTRSEGLRMTFLLCQSFVV
jgi:hypothetical protein